MTTVEKIEENFYSLKSGSYEAVICCFGATLVKLMVPDKDGKVEDCVLGFNTIPEYDRDRDHNPCFGSIIGRVANRVANARFEIDGVKIELDINCGDKHHLHGGAVGWHRRMWEPQEIQNGLRLTYSSPDGDDRYPGAVDA